MCLVDFGGGGGGGAFPPTTSNSVYWIAIALFKIPEEIGIKVSSPPKKTRQLNVVKMSIDVD